MHKHPQLGYTQLTIENDILCKVKFCKHVLRLNGLKDKYTSLANLNTSDSGLHHTISLMYVGARHLGFGIT